jgi:cysteine sulfinate desulfinase/cysteine desulfurase-like protein
MDMRDALHTGIINDLPQVKLNGHPDKRLPNTLSLSFPGMQANVLLSKIPGVAASAGAACHTDSIKISSVLAAMKIPEEIAMGTIRFSTGKYSTIQEMKTAAKEVAIASKRLYSSK